MIKKKKPGEPDQKSKPEKHPDITQPPDPEEPFVSEEESEIIPDEDPFENAADEAPPPGEGPL